MPYTLANAKHTEHLKILNRTSLRNKFLAQNIFFSCAAGKALTTVLAGLALTTHILPKISLLPALVAGLLRVLILQRPEKLNAPFFFTSAVMVSARPATPC